MFWRIKLTSILIVLKNASEAFGRSLTAGM
jgi:hypothetical protein